MRWVLVVVWLVYSAGDARAAETCDSSAETVIGYSAQRDQYLTEERSVDAAEPPRYVIRRLTTDEVVDYVTCADADRCTKGDALGLKACSFRPVPRNIPDDLSLAVAGSDESVAEVRGAEEEEVRSRCSASDAREGSSFAAVCAPLPTLILFVSDTVDDETAVRAPMNGRSW